LNVDSLIKSLSGFDHQRGIKAQDELPKIRAACSSSALVIRALPRIYRGAVAPRATAALLGRFLPRLGPPASRRRPFFVAAQGAIRWEQHGFRMLKGLFVINNSKE
jgi:hypothetical protein